MVSQSVWIAPGCIECFWCQQLADEVFDHGAHGTEIKGAVRLDRQTSSNRSERSALDGTVLSPAAIDFLQFVADGCPVKVIHLEGNWGEIGIADPAISP